MHTTCYPDILPFVDWPCYLLSLVPSMFWLLAVAGFAGAGYWFGNAYPERAKPAWRLGIACFIMSLLLFNVPMANDLLEHLILGR